MTCDENDSLFAILGYLKHAQCLSEGAESDEFKGFMRDMQVMVEKLFEVQFKNRFPLMCW